MSASTSRAPRREPSFPDREVLRLQHWMQHVITHKDGVEAGMIDAPAQCEYPLTPDDLERIVLPSRELSGLERISIYSEMYALRLADVLREDYPVLRHALGDERFDALSRAYVAAHPSRHYNLNQLGKQLPGYVEQSNVKHAAFFADVARLERAATDVFDADGAPTLALAELERVEPQAWPNLALSLVPATRLLEFRYPVNRYYVDVKEGRNPRRPKPGATWTLVYRKDFVVWRANLSREQHALLAALAGGATLGTALEACGERDDLDVARLQQQLGAWFREWSAEGVFRSLA